MGWRFLGRRLGLVGATAGVVATAASSSSGGARGEDVVVDMGHLGPAGFDASQPAAEPDRFYDCTVDHSKVGDLEQGGNLEQAAAAGVTIKEAARGPLLALLHSELRGGDGSTATWKEIVGVTKQEYLSRVEQGLPVVELVDVGARQVGGGHGGESVWIPRGK